MISVLARSAPPLAACVAALVLSAAHAHAQAGPGPFPSGPSGGEEEEKKEGVAEAAPKSPALLPTTPSLPAPKSRRKKFELIELDGYFRLRTDWFKNFHLGFNDDPAQGGAPFSHAPGCFFALARRPCDDTLASANLRLRLEPTINIDETISVHTQIDVFDNLVLGSTPEGTFYDGTSPPGDVPIGAFSQGQTVQQAGVNESRDAIRVKRAWGEISKFVHLSFGRMPDHWGLGVVHNSGGEDPINGGYDLDGDYGDTVDRVFFSMPIPSTNINAGVGLDWPVTGLVSSQTQGQVPITTGDTTITQRRDQSTGQPWDLDDSDDVTQWVFVLSRMDAPTDFADALDRGELVLNYGAYLTYRTQDWDNLQPDVRIGGTTSATGLFPRDYSAYVPDLWLKAGWRDFLFELEAATVIGSFNTREGDTTRKIDLRQLGGVARFTYKAVEDKLRIGLEGGFASGDQWDNTPPGRINVRYASGVPAAGDDDMTQFIFDRDYKVDLILFRELMGAVSNAVYARPFLSYDLTGSIVMRVQNVTSFAHRKVATPGNAPMYGIEFDGDLGYQGRNFFAGISYGVLFPLSAMNHPADPNPGDADDPFGFGANTGDAGNAHTIQSRLVLRF